MPEWEILPLQGLPSIPFGCSEQHVISILGKPTNRLPVEESGFYLSYSDNDIAFFFSEDDLPILEDIEVSIQGCVKLWGHDLIPSNEETIRKLIRKNSPTDIREERNEDDLLIVAEDQLLYFFFEGGVLQEVLWSAAAE